MWKTGRKDRGRVGFMMAVVEEMGGCGHCRGARRGSGTHWVPWDAIGAAAAQIQGLPLLLGHFPLPVPLFRASKSAPRRPRWQISVSGHVGPLHDPRIINSSRSSRFSSPPSLSSEPL